VSTQQTETPLEIRAEAKWVRISPRKARLVAEHIRGRSVLEARSVLAFTPREAARELDKVLRSAVANAESQHQLPDDRLYVSAAYVDEGPMMKRWRARARGRVARIKKRTCHITVKVAEIPAAQPPVRAKRGPGEGARGNREVPPAESKAPSEKAAAQKKAPAKKKPEEAKT
jgi:large subunit ribosomal protein L22